MGRTGTLSQLLMGTCQVLVRNLGHHHGNTDASNFFVSILPVTSIHVFMFKHKSRCKVKKKKIPLGKIFSTTYSWQNKKNTNACLHRKYLKYVSNIIGGHYCLKFSVCLFTCVSIVSAECCLLCKMTTSPSGITQGTIFV